MRDLVAQRDLSKLLWQETEHSSWVLWNHKGPNSWPGCVLCVLTVGSDMEVLGTSKNLLHEPIAASGARSCLAYHLDMSLRSLRDSLHSVRS